MIGICEWAVKYIGLYLNIFIHSFKKMITEKIKRPRSIFGICNIVHVIAIAMKLNEYKNKINWESFPDILNIYIVLLPNWTSLLFNCKVFAILNFLSNLVNYLSHFNMILNFLKCFCFDPIGRRSVHIPASFRTTDQLFISTYIKVVQILGIT